MREERPLVWLSGEIKTPPFSREGRIEAGFLLRRLQRGERLEMPHPRAMPAVGPRCGELRVRDETETWRIMYRSDPDAIMILEVFSKKTHSTPKWVIENCRRRLQRYDSEANR